MLTKGFYGKYCVSFYVVSRLFNFYFFKSRTVRMLFQVGHACLQKWITYLGYLLIRFDHIECTISQHLYNMIKNLEKYILYVWTNHFRFLFDVYDNLWLSVYTLNEQLSWDFQKKNWKFIVINPRCLVCRWCECATWTNGTFVVGSCNQQHASREFLCSNHNVCFHRSVILINKSKEIIFSH